MLSSVAFCSRRLDATSLIASGFATCLICSRSAVMPALARGDLLQRAFDALSRIRRELVDVLVHLAAERVHLLVVDHALTQDERVDRRQRRPAERQRRERHRDVGGIVATTSVSESGRRRA
jgi:hypothetical protein